MVLNELSIVSEDYILFASVIFSKIENSFEHALEDSDLGAKINRSLFDIQISHQELCTYASPAYNVYYFPLLLLFFLVIFTKAFHPLAFIAFCCDMAFSSASCALKNVNEKNKIS